MKETQHLLHLEDCGIVERLQEWHTSCPSTQHLSALQLSEICQIMKACLFSEFPFRLLAGTLTSLLSGLHNSLSDVRHFDWFQQEMDSRQRATGMSVLGINSAESFSHLFGCHTYLTLGINIGCYLKYHHGTESGREALRLSAYCQTDMYCICRFMGRGEKVVLTCKCVFVKVKPQQLLNKLSSCVYCLCGTRNSVLCFRIQALTMV